MNIRLLLLFGLLLAMPAISPAQSLPRDWQITPDGHRLVIGGQDATGLYDSTAIRSLYLDFSQPNYWQLLTQNYQNHVDLLANLTVDGVLYDSIGARFKGQTSYQQVQGQKKSFNLSLNYIHPNQDLIGYKTLNLNNCYLDESFIREVFFLNQIKKHIPAAKANYVHLYINNQDWGLYPSIQQLNKDFLREWYLSNDGCNWRADRPTGGPGGPGGGGPGWGDGTAAMNYLTADTADYQQYYTLKSSDIANPWDYLLQTCDMLENTPINNLPNVLPNFLDVDRTLWFLASEVAFSDDDSYIYKGKMDYYCYYEPETGRMTPQEYDGNSVIDPAHVQWSPFYNEQNANYPLLNRILAVPQYRQRYLAHLRTIIADEMDPTTCNAIIDNYKAQIDALVQADPKKIYTYVQFNNEIPILKNFINNRRTYLLSNSEVAQVAPVINSASYSNLQGSPWTPPLDNEEVTVNAQVTAGVNGLNQVTAFYATGLVGNFTALTMYDDGQHNDGASGDGLFGVNLPAQAAGTWVRFYIQATANNNARSVSYMPAGAEHDVYIYVVAPLVAQNSAIAINEVMASNATTMADNAGEFDDWIELYNRSNADVDLSGWYLSDNPANLDKWEIPQGTILPANEYAIFWADEDSIQGPNHCNFKLSGSGETLWLLNSNLEMVDSVNFGLQVTDMGYARVPNGIGGFVIQGPTFGANNDPVSVGALATNDKMTVYPNPASGLIHLLLPSALAMSDGTAVLFDMFGRAVASTALTPGSATSLEVSGLARGVYVLQVRDASGQEIGNERVVLAP